MPRVIALQSMEHSGPRRRGDTFEVSPHIAEQLARRGLARVLGDGGSSLDPSQAAGATLSASPAAPASPQTTATGSTGGARRGRRANAE